MPMTEPSLALGPTALGAAELTRVDLRDPFLTAPAARVGPVTGSATAASAAASVTRVLAALRTSDAAAFAVAAGGAGLLAGALRGHSLGVDVLLGLVAVMVAVPAWLWSLRLARAYEPRYLFAGSAEIQRVAIAGAAAALVATAGGWLALDRREAPVVLGALAVGIGLTVAGRWVIRMRVQRANRAGEVRTAVLVVGGERESTTLTARIERNRYHGWQVAAACDVAGPGSPEQVVESVVRAADRAGASLVLLAPGAATALASVAELQRALHAAGRDLALAPPMVEAVGPRVSVGSVCGLPVVRLSPPEFTGPRRVLKDLADRVVAGAAVLVLLPAFVAVGLAVRLTSPGPALYRQKRVGRDGRLFTVLKFRSMYVDADARQADVDTRNEGAGPLFKMKRDPRITRVGRWLRRTSMDELPQLVNVALGDMSLVGPRPALPREVAAYDDLTRRRLLVRPGLTGLWQIHGRSDLSWEETRRLDVRYVENWSLGFDLSILVRTVDAVLRGRGAY
jgi:exopolysaccharide biosynthesis polyprenyl glycosylphosphotransferase